MPQLTQEKTREIINDFAAEIRKRKRHAAVKPDKTVISFRDESAHGIEREIWDVPIELLRYRKENGRIASDVLSFEKENLTTLDEKTEEAQKILKDFLYKKDTEKTIELKNSIKNENQREPAIITVDGFLINGNRRKMVLEMLNEESPAKYKTMRVVILPGTDEEGGAPTIQEIELIENRYQLQLTGHSDYKGIDRALSISRKMDLGISLQTQLQDDSTYSGLNIDSAEFKRVVEDHRKRYLHPLEKVNQYLESIGQPGCYDLIGDRWQAFIDYSNFYFGNLQKSSWQNRSGVSSDEIGDVEDLAFKIIRKKNIAGQKKKLHQLMRDLPSLLEVPEAKQELFALTRKVKELEPGNAPENSDLKDKDLIWGEKNNSEFSRSISRAFSFLEEKKENENAMNLLNAAYRKITHPNMLIDKIPSNELQSFMKQTNELIDILREKKQEAYRRIKG